MQYDDRFDGELATASVVAELHSAACHAEAQRRQVSPICNRHGAEKFRRARTAGAPQNPILRYLPSLRFGMAGGRLQNLRYDSPALRFHARFHFSFGAPANPPAFTSVSVFVSRPCSRQNASRPRKASQPKNAWNGPTV